MSNVKDTSYTPQVSTETISLGGIQKCELRNVRAAVGMFTKHSTSTSLNLCCECSNVFLVILSGYFRFSMLSDNPVCEA